MQLTVTHVLGEYDVEQMLHDALGTEAITARDVAWDLKNPCNDCPFKRKTAFHEGVAGGLPQLIESLEDGRFAHTCHKTDNRSNCDGPRNHDGPVQHCAGALLMLLKPRSKHGLQLPLLQAAEAGKFDLDDMIQRAKGRPDIHTPASLL